MTKTKTSKTVKITMSALFAALVFCATTFFRLPLPAFGYVNLGDAFVLLSGVLLGPLWGGFASAVGSALSDLVGPYAHYAIPTFLIKGLMALLAALLWRSIGKKHPRTALCCFALPSEILMVLGYLGFEALIYGFFPALVSVPYNAVQGVFGAVLATVVLLFLKRVPSLSSRL